MANFIIGDYEYTTFASSTPNTVEATVVDNTKPTYSDIPATVTYNNVVYNVTSLYGCFRDCENLKVSPNIPNTITNMGWCFYGCLSLNTAPVIPSSVESMAYCFAGCTSLSGDVYIYTTYDSPSYLQCFYDTSHAICLHAMNNNIEECDALAGTANNNNVYVNVKPETALNFNNTQVNYLNQNSEFIALSMQTNANLIQCRIPKLSGGGASIITTNLNDALIDLYKRKVGGA